MEQARNAGHKAVVTWGKVNEQVCSWESKFERQIGSVGGDNNGFLAENGGDRLHLVHPLGAGHASARVH